MKYILTILALITTLQATSAFGADSSTSSSTFTLSYQDRVRALKGLCKTESYGILAMYCAMVKKQAADCEDRFKYEDILLNRWDGLFEYAQKIHDSPIGSCKGGVDYCISQDWRITRLYEIRSTMKAYEAKVGANRAQIQKLNCELYPSGIAFSDIIDLIIDLKKPHGHPPSIYKDL